MTEELKPCPFCGGTANIAKCQIEFLAYCTHCGVQTELYETEKEVAKAWNTRKIENELVEKIEKFEMENHTLRLALEEIARGFDTDSWDYTREGMMRIAKEALK